MCIEPQPRRGCCTAKATRSKAQRGCQAELRPAPPGQSLRGCFQHAQGLTEQLSWQVKKPYHKRENIGCFGSRKYSNLAYRCQDIRDAGWFQTTLIAVIGVAGVLVGIQTYDIPPGTFQDTIEYV